MRMSLLSAAVVLLSIALAPLPASAGGAHDDAAGALGTALAFGFGLGVAAGFARGTDTQGCRGITVGVA